MFSGERTVQANLYQTVFMALCIEGIDGFLYSFADRTHSNYNMFRIRCTYIIEQLIICTNLVVNLVQVFFYDAGNSIIVLVAGFSGLEEHIRVLGSTFQERTLRIHGVFTEIIDSIHIEHIFKVFEIPDFNFLNFMGSAETIKEVQERNLTLNSGQMSGSAQVHNFLYTAGA